MQSGERFDAFALLRERVDEAALGAALTLFTDREDLGFIWLGFADDRPVGVCVATTAIALGAGGLVLRIGDIAIVEDVDPIGVARQMLAALVKHVRAFGIARFEAQAPEGDVRARTLYAACGFQPDRAETVYILAP